MIDDEENGLSSQIKEKVKQETKNGAKKIGKRILKMALPYIAILLVVLMIASAVYAIFSVVVETIKNVGQTIINTILDFFKGNDTAIEIDDSQIDQLIEVIEATGIDLEDLELLR